MSFRLKFRNYSRVNSRRSTRVICLIANSSNLKDALEQRFPDIVDQAVVACSSDGKSRGCAFVTVRWQEFVNKDSTGKPEHVVKQFCDSVNSAPILGRPVFIELARSQRRASRSRSPCKCPHEADRAFANSPVSSDGGKCKRLYGEFGYPV
mmetsp:Transcript_37204/g.99001  ORF Transcript_37204/g.99001 Transcript_37204/m.99001 type:complete len:151 (-) Transcript_37204:560-1012(-)